MLGELILLVRWTNTPQLKSEPLSSVCVRWCYTEWPSLFQPLDAVGLGPLSSTACLSTASPPCSGATFVTSSCMDWWGRDCSVEVCQLVTNPYPHHPPKLKEREKEREKYLFLLTQHSWFLNLEIVAMNNHLLKCKDDLESVFKIDDKKKLIIQWLCKKVWQRIIYVWVVWIFFGFFCTDCGMCCHRYCSATHPTDCNVPKFERLRRPSFSQSKSPSIVILLYCYIGIDRLYLGVSWLLLCTDLWLSLVDSSFGAELTEEVPKSQYGAPWVIVKCTEEVEKWCRNHRK